MNREFARRLYHRAQVAAITAAAIEMERNGFLVDAEYCARQAERARADEQATLAQLRLELAALGVPPLPGADNIWSSPVQMGLLFHGVLGCPKSPVWKKGNVKLDKGQVKLDEVALRWVALRDPRVRALVSNVIQLRQIRGGIKYLTKLPTYIAADGRVHPVCGPAGDGDDRVGALTGRFAFKNPEGQQIPSNPKKDRYAIRRAFIAGAGNRLIVADYSTLEVTILAHILIVLFNDDQLARMVAPEAPDIHSYNARKVFGEFLGRTLSNGRRVADLELHEFQDDDNKEAKAYRQLIKEIWYGLMYGKGAYGFGASLTDQAGNPIGEDEAGRIVNALLDSIPALRKYQEWVMAFIKEHHGIPSLAGRWCPLEDLVRRGSEWALARAWRRALNFPMQAGAADIVGAAMVAVVNDRELRARGFILILQIHDELVIEGPEEHAEWAAARLKYLMETAFPLRVGLRVKAKVARSWEEGK